MSVISALVKGTPRAFHPLLCKDTARRQQSMNQESDPYQTLKLPAPLTLDFLASRTARCQFLFKPLSLCYFCYHILNGLRQGKRR